MTPGDVVVCVSVMKPCICAVPMDSPNVPNPIVGRHYRVAVFGTGNCQDCRETHAAIVPTTPHLGTACWPASCFRRLEPSTEDIFLMASTPLETVS